MKQSAQDVCATIHYSAMKGLWYVEVTINGARMYGDFGPLDVCRHWAMRAVGDNFNVAHDDVERYRKAIA